MIRFHKSQIIVSFSLAIWVLPNLVLAMPAAAPADDAFERDIRPLLIQNCQKCHSDKKQQGGLRLDSRQALLKGGDTGPAIVPGNPNDSLLIQAVRHTADLKMPATKKLPDEQIAKLERWVAEGAYWPPNQAKTTTKACYQSPPALSARHRLAPHQYRPIHFGPHGSSPTGTPSTC
jgi:mono/diheme cytochrome c family protein